MSGREKVITSTRKNRGSVYLPLLVGLAVVGLVGWKIYSVSQSNKATPPVVTSAPKDLGGFMKYENKTLGFVFSYPKEWGTVISSSHEDSKRIGGFKGEWLTIRFTSNNKVTLEGISKDFTMLAGRDGGDCAGALIYGRLVDYRMLKLRNLGQFNSLGSGAKEYKAFLVTNDSYYVYESFEYYPAGSEPAIGSCPGYTVAGAKVFTSESKLRGVAFDWYQYGVDCCTNKPIELDYQNFVKDKNAVLSADEKAKIVKLIQSIREF